MTKYRNMSRETLNLRTRDGSFASLRAGDEDDLDLDEEFPQNSGALHAGLLSRAVEGRPAEGGRRRGGGSKRRQEPAPSE